MMGTLTNTAGYVAAHFEFWLAHAKCLEEEEEEVKNVELHFVEATKGRFKPKRD